MLAILRNPDVEVVQALRAQVFNDWEAEFVAYDPKRLIGVSVIPMHDVDWAVTELERTLRKGLVGPMINCQTPEAVHPTETLSTIASGRSLRKRRHRSPASSPGACFRRSPGDTQTPLERGANPHRMLELFGEIQAVPANDFIFGGILDRFPRLNVVCSEFELSWIPHFMWRIDELQDPYGFGPRMHLPARSEGDDYMKTRIYHGLIDDAYGPQMIPLIGADRVLWGSDFPHIRSIGLGAQEHVQKLFGALPHRTRSVRWAATPRRCSRYARVRKHWEELDGVAFKDDLHVRLIVFQNKRPGGDGMTLHRTAAEGFNHEAWGRRSRLL